MIRLARAAAVAIGVAAFWLSLTPQPPKPPGLPPFSDLGAHFAMHATLAGALAVGWAAKTAAAVAWTAALFLEIGQAQVPGRTFSLLDLGANAVGVLAGLRAGAVAQRWITSGLEARPRG
jgi:VanZ family protein